MFWITPQSNGAWALVSMFFFFSLHFMLILNFINFKFDYSTNVNWWIEHSTSHPASKVIIRCNDNEQTNKNEHTFGIVIYLFDYYIVYFHVSDRKFSIYTMPNIAPSHQRSGERASRERHREYVNGCVRQHDNMPTKMKMYKIYRRFTLLSHRDISQTPKTRTKKRARQHERMLRLIRSIRMSGKK